MKPSGAPTSTSPVETAADRDMLLWSMIRLLPGDKLTPIRASLVERLSEQQHLTEDELVVVGLKYLHQIIGLKK